MRTAILTHPDCALHEMGEGHPESPQRLRSVMRALEESGLAAKLMALEAPAAEREHLERVHDPEHVDLVFGAAPDRGYAYLDPDTSMNPKSLSAALRAAGAVVKATDLVMAGEARNAFCAVRPPGHHATPTTAMGFCLVSNISVVAAALAERGERVWIFDFDAHHGNGTQAVFEADPRVLFVSLHEWPLYPGTGRATETGTGDGLGTTLNVPLPAGATGDIYLHAFDEVIAPVVERFAPTWLLISAGFDAHRADPLTDMGLSAGDYPALVRRALALVPPRRTIAMLEGGYDLAALQASTAGVLGALAGLDLRPETPTSGGPGADAVARVSAIWAT